MIDDDLEERLAVEEPVVTAQTDGDRLRNKRYAAAGCLTMFAYGLAAAYGIYNDPEPSYYYCMAAVTLALTIFAVYRATTSSPCILENNVRANENDVDSDRGNSV